MLMDNATAVDTDELRARIEGAVVAPQDETWDEARAAWNLAVDQRPALAPTPQSAADVVAIVDFARERGMRVAPQGTGHNASAIATLERTILVKTSALRDVVIDVAGRRARAGAGVLWAEFTGPASEHGLSPLAGSSRDVGVVGYTLGGGPSWLSRRHGLAANSVLAIELVTADGRLVRCDRDHEPELFWALRGGGGSFGGVNAVQFVLYPPAPAAAPAASCPRSSSSSTPPRRCTPARCSGRGSGRPRCSSATSRGAARRRTRSRPRSACSRCRRCRTSRSPSAAASSWPSTAPTWAPQRRPPRCSRRCARSS